MSEYRTRIWYTQAYDPHSKKWLSIEHMEQVVGEFDKHSEALHDGEIRLRYGNSEK